VTLDWFGDPDRQSALADTLHGGGMDDATP